MNNNMADADADADADTAYPDPDPDSAINSFDLISYKSSIYYTALYSLCNPNNPNCHYLTSKEDFITLINTAKSVAATDKYKQQYNNTSTSTSINWDNEFESFFLLSDSIEYSTLDEYIRTSTNNKYKLYSQIANSGENKGKHCIDIADINYYSDSESELPPIAAAVNNKSIKFNTNTNTAAKSSTATAAAGKSKLINSTAIITASATIAAELDDESEFNSESDSDSFNSVDSRNRRSRSRSASTSISISISSSHRNRLNSKKSNKLSNNNSTTNNNNDNNITYLSCRHICADSNNHLIKDRNRNRNRILDQDQDRDTVKYLYNPLKVHECNTRKHPNCNRECRIQLNLIYSSRRKQKNTVLLDPDNFNKEETYISLLKQHKYRNNSNNNNNNSNNYIKINSNSRSQSNSQPQPQPQPQSQPQSQSQPQPQPQPRSYSHLSLAQLNTIIQQKPIIKFTPNIDTTNNQSNQQQQQQQQQSQSQSNSASNTDNNTNKPIYTSELFIEYSNTLDNNNSKLKFDSICLLIYSTLYNTSNNQIANSNLLFKSMRNQLQSTAGKSADYYRELYTDIIINIENSLKWIKLLELLFPGTNSNPIDENTNIISNERKYLNEWIHNNQSIMNGQSIESTKRGVIRLVQYKPQTQTQTPTQSDSDCNLSAEAAAAAPPEPISATVGAESTLRRAKRFKSEQSDSNTNSSSSAAAAIANDSQTQSIPIDLSSINPQSLLDSAFATVYQSMKQLIMPTMINNSRELIESQLLIEQHSNTINQLTIELNEQQQLIQQLQSKLTEIREQQQDQQQLQSNSTAIINQQIIESKQIEIDI